MKYNYLHFIHGSRKGHFCLMPGKMRYNRNQVFYLHHSWE